MRFADAEQLLGVALVVVWLLAAALSMAGRFPDGGKLSAATLLGTGIAAGLFTLQAAVVDAVADPDGISAADAPALQWFVEHRTPAFTAVAVAIGTVGGTAGMAVLAAAVALVLWFRRRRWEAGVVIVAASGAGVLVETLKNLYDRSRPPEVTRLTVETNYSLPSGHALARPSCSASSPRRRSWCCAACPPGRARSWSRPWRSPPSEGRGSTSGCTGSPTSSTGGWSGAPGWRCASRCSCTAAPSRCPTPTRACPPTNPPPAAPTPKPPE
jgi:hypothetical protein